MPRSLEDDDYKGNGHRHAPARPAELPESREGGARGGHGGQNRSPAQQSSAVTPLRDDDRHSLCPSDSSDDSDSDGGGAPPIKSPVVSPGMPGQMKSPVAPNWGSVGGPAPNKGGNMLNTDSRAKSMHALKASQPMVNGAGPRRASHGYVSNFNIQ